MTFEEIAATVRERTQKMHEAREAGLSQCRLVIQNSSKAIRHMHRHEFGEADKKLAEATRLAESARAAMKGFGEIYYAGYLHDAEKELVEAYAVRAMLQGQPLPLPDELGVGVMAYLNGMGEASSECRRSVLDEARKGDPAKAEKLLEEMEAIYDELITFDYADSMTGGLRRTCDALRAVLERTRNDLTASADQRLLVEELRKTQSRLES